jgi:hypothetical protein
MRVRLFRNKIGDSAPPLLKKVSSKKMGKDIKSELSRACIESPRQTYRSDLSSELTPSET